MRSLVSRNSRGSTQYTLGPGHGRSGSSSVPGLGRRLLLGHSAPPRGPPSGIAVLGQREFSSSPSSCSTFSLRLSYGCLIWVMILGIWGFWLAASLLDFDFDFSLGFPLTSAPPCRTPTSSSTTARSARGSPRHCIAPATAAPRGRSGGARPYHRCQGMRTTAAIAASMPCPTSAAASCVEQAADGEEQASADAVTPAASCSSSSSASSPVSSTTRHNRVY